jgi:two-component system sensor histidine kinase YesM
MDYLIEFLTRDEAVASFLSGLAPGPAGELNRVLEHLRASRPDVAGIMVVNQDARIASANLDPVNRDALTRETWYRLALITPHRIRLQARPVDRNVRNREGLSADDVVAVTKAVTDPSTGRPRGVILVDLKLSALEGLFAQTSMGDGGFLCVADGAGHFVWAPPVPVAYRLDPDWFAESGKSVVARIEDKRYQILTQRSPYTGWDTIGVFSLTEALREVTFLQYATLGISLASLLLAALASLYFTMSFSRPVLALRGAMKKAEEGDLAVRFDHGPDDEIGQLGNSFNTMLAEIRNLVDQVWAEQKSKQEAELKTLQAQIKPHFLYNTLDTIQWMAAERGAEDIQTVVGALSDLFRIGLSRGQEMIPLDRELDHIRSYLLIQKTRYEDGLEYSIADTGELGSVPVLKLILQPLVENAIYHGIKEAGRPGRLEVGARKEDGVLVLTVEDDGIGMVPARLKEVRRNLAERPLRGWDGETSGYGIYSVNARIRLSFGPAYGLEFDSRPGGGTRVEIRIPITPEENP